MEFKLPAFSFLKTYCLLHPFFQLDAPSDWGIFTNQSFRVITPLVHNVLYTPLTLSGHRRVQGLLMSRSST